MFARIITFVSPAALLRRVPGLRGERSWQDVSTPPAPSGGRRCPKPPSPRGALAAIKKTQQRSSSTPQPERFVGDEPANCEPARESHRAWHPLRRDTLPAVKSVSGSRGTPTHHPEGERSAARSPVLPGPSPLSDRPGRSSPIQPGSDPGPFPRRRGRGRGEALSADAKPQAVSAAGVCVRLSFPRQVGGSPGEGAAVLPCHGRALLLRARARSSVGSAGWARHPPGAVRTRQASAQWRGELFGPNLSNFFFFLKIKIFAR